MDRYLIICESRTTSKIKSKAILVSFWFRQVSNQGIVHRSVWPNQVVRPYVGGAAPTGYLADEGKYRDAAFLPCCCQRRCDLPISNATVAPIPNTFQAMS